MENNDIQNENDTTCKCGCKCKKILLIAFACFLGSFLAFYVLMHQTMIHCFHSHHKHMRAMQERFFDDFERDFREMKNLSGEGFNHLQKKISAIHTIKDENAYVIVVDLKKFNNDEKNINFELNGNIVTISGNITDKKKHKENFYNFTESFAIPEQIDSNDIKKEKINDKYIITIPLED